MAHKTADGRLVVYAGSKFRVKLIHEESGDFFLVDPDTGAGGTWVSQRNCAAPEEEQPREQTQPEQSEESAAAESSATAEPAVDAEPVLDAGIDTGPAAGNGGNGEQ